ncbi:MAG TPA: cation:proton antiporter [Longimicrobiaceae bacterium]|nr:cation:proton antiporter [Longimicrobiaceae bacterium]
MTTPFTAAPHHYVLLLLVQITVLLFAARALAELAQRLGQPSVVGEILAGIVLGPSLLSGLVPGLGAWIVPQGELGGYLLEVVSLIGALYLLMITGLETDLGLIRQHARTAIGVSLGGICLTFSSGFILGELLPDGLLARPGTGQRLVFSLFVATAMSISAIPVIAKVLMDMNLMRRDIGQTIIAAGMSDDTTGWILLSIVSGLATSGVVDPTSVLSSVGKVAAFMVVSFTVGRWLVRRLLDRVQDEVRSADRLVTLVVVLSFAWAAVTQALGLEAVLGAFVMGILFGQMPRLPSAVHQQLTTSSRAVFTPVFFGVAGLKVDIRALLEPRLILITLLVIAVAAGGKIAGTYLGARLIGRRDHWTSLSFGAGLNARGAMEIIIATIGLQLGILSQDMFSIIVVMAMATSLMAPPALRWVLARVTPEAQELERLRREELAAGSRVAQIHRVLLPVRRRPEPDVVHALHAEVLAQLAAEGPLALTLLNVAPPGEKAAAAAFLDEVGALFPATELAKKIVESRDPAAVIIEEAQKDYDLLVLGATERSNARQDSIFHPLVDRIVRLAPCPTLVIRGTAGRSAAGPQRILVPTNGSSASREAGMLAFRLAGPDDLVVVLNVVRADDGDPGRELWGTQARQFETAQGIVRELQKLGEAQGARTLPMLRAGGEAEDVMLDVARDLRCTLIVLGTDVRPGSERLFLGPRVERLLETAPCPVLVYNAS